MPRPTTRDGARLAIFAEDVKKRMGQVQALNGINLEVPEGTVLGLLGQNGAGKTTVVRILATLLRADEGRAEVAGFDVVRDRAQVRAVIGLSGQYAAVDERLTARENLKLMSNLYHLSQREISKVVPDLLERFELVEAADRPARTFSGGMRRRLDLAASLVGRPQVLFLDEPSVGLDPPGRIRLWSVVEELVEEGVTVLLTTQYLEEADRLADAIAVIASGAVIAGGTASELKSAAGEWFIEVTVANRDEVQAAADVIAAVASVKSADAQISRHAGRVSLPVAGSGVPIGEVAGRLEAASIEFADLALRQPTLDDVFMALTGNLPPAGAKE